MADMPTVIDELANLPTRIRTSVERLAELTKQVTDERRVRDQLIVEAVDHAGMTEAEVARIAGMTQTHVGRILIAASED